MRPVTVSVGPLAAASANNIATSQTPGGAGNLTLNGTLVSGGVAVLDSPRRILITTTDSTRTFTVTGTSQTGTVLTETMKSNGTNVQSTLDYTTVTNIAISAAAGAAVTVGTNGVAATPWVRLDEWANTQTAIQIDVTGTVNYTVQSSLDDPNSATNSVLPQNMVWINTNDTNVVNATSSLQTNYAFSPHLREGPPE